MFKKSKLIVLLAITIALVTSGFSCKLIPTKQPPASLTKQIELSYWGVWDDSDHLEPIIYDFEALHPNVTIKYKKFRFSEYEQMLLEAWAEDRGPDIYSLPATWLREYQNRISPQPENVSLAFREVKKTLGKTEINTVVRSVPILRPNDIKSQFVDVVYDDVVMDNQVYGLPYSVDSLVLFYNRELLDNAGVATPPATWTELKETVKALTRIDQNNNLIQSGVALGTANNIANAADLVSLLMMQNGTQMVDERGQAAFHKSASGEKGYSPGQEALRFYTDFADPIKEVYSWNSSQPEALDAFISGKLAMFFGYSHNLPVITGRAPKLEVNLSAMPQIQGASKPINYTDYWVETVSHKSENAEVAWGFLNFAARADEVTKYLERAKKPAALRSLINGQKEDPLLAVFANQTLTAEHWYQGLDAAKMKEIFAELIEDFPESPEPAQVLEYAAARINQTLK